MISLLGEIGLSAPQSTVTASGAQGTGIYRKFLTCYAWRLRWISEKEHGIHNRLHRDG
jgi:hypothetical protein